MRISRNILLTSAGARLGRTSTRLPHLARPIPTQRNIDHQTQLLDEPIERAALKHRNRLVGPRTRVRGAGHDIRGDIPPRVERDGNRTGCPFHSVDATARGVESRASGGVAARLAVVNNGVCFGSLNAAAGVLGLVGRVDVAVGGAHCAGEGFGGGVERAACRCVQGHAVGDGVVDGFEEVNFARVAWPGACGVDEPECGPGAAAGWGGRDVCEQEAVRP